MLGDFTTHALYVDNALEPNGSTGQVTCYYFQLCWEWYNSTMEGFEIR